MKLKNLLFRQIALMAFMLFGGFGVLQAQTTYSLSTSPPHTNSTSTSSGSGMTFNLKAKVAPLNITNIKIGFTGTSGGYEVWYNKDSINGVPLVTTGNGWILHETGSWTGSGIIDLQMKKEVKIPVGKTYGFVVVNTTGSGNYSSNAGLQQTFNDPNLQLHMGPGVAYVVYGSPVGTSNIANRFFVGTIEYEFGYSAPNDAGIVELVKPKTFCPSTQDIEIKIQNFGSNQVSSVQVNWSLNGTLQSPIKYNLVLDTLQGSGNNTANIKLGSLVFSSTTSHTIKAWTSLPNNQSDTVNANDTFTVTLKPSLSGTFTIGGTNPNYQTFAAAANDLNAFGVCGPVLFNVRPGTYNERLVLNAITGASATNTITFDGAAKNLVTLQNAGTATTNWHTVLLDGADYIRIKNMTIKGTGASYGIGIFLTGNAQYNQVLNCDVEVSTTSTSTNFSGIVASGSSTSISTSGDNASHNLFRDNIVTGGYYGIRFYGSGSSTPTSKGNRFIGNTIENFHYYGMSLYQLDSVTIKGNNINTTRNGSLSDGIFLYYATEFTIEANKISVPDYGLYVYYSNNYQNYGRGRIVNNMILSASDYAIDFYYSYNADILHNTFVTNGTTDAGYFYNANQINVQSNIFAAPQSASAQAFYSTGSTYEKLDYNIYYAPLTSTPIYHNANYASLAAWQAAEPALNKNSLEQDPGFVSSTNLHLVSTGTQTRPYGPNLGLMEDVDGDLRCVVPTIGADESFIGKTSPNIVSNFTVPDTIFVNSPAIFASSAPSGALQKHSWYINGVKIIDSLHAKLLFTSTGTHTVKLVALNCQASDSTTKTVTVVNPTTAPSVRFLASRNIVRQGETVLLSDLSTSGPTAWKWEISPKFAVVNAVQVETFNYAYGDTTTQSPAVRFFEPGKYTITLTASNNLGSSTLTKTAYIEVLTLVTLNGPIITRQSTGFIVDDGGPEGNYADKKTHSVLIDGCASEVFLAFNSFDLECGYDYLRIYDGEFNNGIPLHPCKTNGGFSANGPGFTGGASGGCSYSCVPQPNDTFVAKSGKMYIEWFSDDATNAAGFEAFWWSTPKNVPKPVASFTASQDSICPSTVVNFTGTSTGDDPKYLWDVDGDLSTFEFTGTNAAFPYFALGEHTITLIVSNCGGTDTFQKNITVYAPSTPNISFTADNRNPALTDVVLLQPQIPECISEYKWSFMPAQGNKGSAFFVNGTSATSANPQVQFTDTGCYSVKLWASNFSGADSFTRTCYIRVKKPYCIPSVVNNFADIGISYVELGTIKSTSTAGKNDYENFTTTHSTILETGVEYNLTVARKTNFNAVTRNVWIDWNQDGDFNDAGEMVGQQTNSNSLSWTTKIMVPVAAEHGATIMRVAITEGLMSNRVCGDNIYGEFEDYRLYIQPDLTAPVITLIGSDTIYVEQGSAYTDAGVTAKDNLDGDVTANVVTTIAPKFNNLIPNTYVFSYNVSDAAANKAKTVRRVVIVIADTSAPELVVALPEIIQLQVNTPFTYPKVLSAEDNVDGNVMGRVDTVSNVNAGEVGLYMVTYTVKDMSGNIASVTRNVEVIDTIMPVMILNGNDTTLHAVGTAYTDMDVTLSDDYYSESELRSNLAVQSNVNENEVGDYTVVYTLTDPFTKRTVTLIRLVQVRDTTAATLTLIGDTAVYVEVKTKFNDPGIIISDNYSNNLNYTVSGTFYDAFANGTPTTLGTFQVIYTVKDASGNIATITRTVHVVDRTAPVITLNGEEDVIICRWDDYTDAGYTVTDNFNSVSEITVDTLGTYSSTTLPGFFTLYYTAKDASGNTAQTRKRFVLVQTTEVCGTTSINSNSITEKNITVFPNPSTGLVNVKIDGALKGQVRFAVTNLVGQEIAVASNNNMNQNTIQLDLNGQAAGVYMLTVSGDNFKTTKRIVITR